MPLRKQNIQVNATSTEANLSKLLLSFHNRLVTKNSCKLDLRNFPLDEQTCHLAFESCKYTPPKVWSDKMGKIIATLPFKRNS